MYMDSEYITLIKVVSSQNDNLEKNISEIQDKRTTDNQIVNYKNEQTSWFNNMNRMLLVFYYLLACIFMYQIMKEKTSSTNKYTAIFVYWCFHL